MKERVILMNIILALISQSRGDNKNKSIFHVIGEVLKIIKTPKVVTNSNDVIGLTVMLKDLVEELMAAGTDTPIDIKHIQTRTRLIGIYHKNVLDVLMAELDLILLMDVDECNANYIKYYAFINEYLSDYSVKKIINEYSFSLSDFGAKAQDREDMIREMNQKLEPFVNVHGGRYTDVRGMVSATDLSDKETLVALYAQTQDMYSSLGLLRTDMQGWNDQLGGGFLRGELVEIQAPSGHGKSETMRKILGGMAINNKPHLLNPKLKPLIVYLTIEDTQRECYEKMFTNFYREEHDSVANLKEFTPEFMYNYLHKRLSSMGYHFKVLEAAKHKMTPEDVCHLIDQLEQDGYEIHTLGLDYMLLLNTSKCPGGNDSEQKKNAYGIIGAHTKTRGITCITAAQVNDADLRAVRAESDEVARDAVGMNVSAGSKQIIHELDMRLFVYTTEGDDGHSYHQMAKGKHRAGKSVPFKLKYAVYRMHAVNGQPGGFIRSDLDGINQVRNCTGGSLRVDGGGAAF